MRTASSATGRWKTAAKRPKEKSRGKPRLFLAVTSRLILNPNDEVKEYMENTTRSSRRNTYTVAMTSTNDAPLSATEAAELLHVNRQTFYQWVYRGQTPKPDYVAGGRKLWKKSTLLSWRTPAEAQRFRHFVQQEQEK